MAALLDDLADELVSVTEPPAVPAGPPMVVGLNVIARRFEPLMPTTAFLVAELRRRLEKRLKARKGAATR